MLLANPRPVTSIRYYAPSGVAVIGNSFVATVDLAGVVPKDGQATVSINVEAVDPRIRVLGFDPAVASILLEPLTSKSVPVQVEHGVVPDGLTLGETVVDPQNVTVSGPESVVAKVVAARADVLIQPSGLDVDQDAQLVPVDQLGNALRSLEVTPPTARVVIPVFSDRQSRTLPVNPVITGTPAAGFEIESVTVDPQVALVAGDADQLAALTRVDTVPIPMTGVSANETVSVDLALPAGVVAVGSEPISVTITIRPVTATRTFNAGLRLLGSSSVLTYALSVDRVLVTIGGSTADLDRLSAATLVVDLDVTGLKPGVHEVPVTANLPAGMTLVAASPPKVTVTISEPSPSGLAGRPSAGDGPGAVRVGRLTRVARLFGTDGIRGVANVDLKPTIAYALGRAVAASPGRTRRGDRGRPGHPPLGRHVRGGDRRRRDEPRGRRPRRRRRPDAGPGVHRGQRPVRGRDHGLRLAQPGRRQRPQGARRRRAQARRRDRGRARAADLADRGAGRRRRTTASAGSIDAAARLDDYLAHRIALAGGGRGGGPAARPRLRQRLGLGGRPADPGGDRRPGRGHPRRARTASTSTSRRARPRRRRWPRRSSRRAPMPGSPSTATPTGSSRSMPAGRVVDGDQVLGILALDRLGRDALPGGGLVVSVLSNGGLQAAVEAAGGQVVRTPVGDKYILEGMQVSGAVLGGEKSGHVIVLEHTTSGDGIVTALEVLRVMARRGASLADLAAAIPLLPQQQRAVKARHKDQWEGDPVLQRAIASASARLGASGRVLVRPSGTEPALRVMVEGPDEALVLELADSLAALAGERLN